MCLPNWYMATVLIFWETDSICSISIKYPVWRDAELSIYRYSWIINNCDWWIRLILPNVKSSGTTGSIGNWQRVSFNPLNKSFVILVTNVGYIRTKHLITSIIPDNTLNKQRCKMYAPDFIRIWILFTHCPNLVLPWRLVFILLIWSSRLTVMSCIRNQFYYLSVFSILYINIALLCDRHTNIDYASMMLL